MKEFFYQNSQLIKDVWQGPKYVYVIQKLVQQKIVIYLKRFPDGCLRGNFFNLCEQST